MTAKTKQPKHVHRHVFYSPFFICAFVSESFGKRVVIDLQFGNLNVERRARVSDLIVDDVQAASRSDRN